MRPQREAGHLHKRRVGRERGRGTPPVCRGMAVGMHNSSRPVAQDVLSRCAQPKWICAMHTALHCLTL
jgi:hypothetical protein